MNYPETHAVAKLKQAIEDTYSGNPNHHRLVEAADRLIDMWERLAAQAQAARDAGSVEITATEAGLIEVTCTRCETIAGLFKPPARKVTADEVITFILDREQASHDEDLATGKGPAGGK